MTCAGIGRALHHGILYAQIDRGCRRTMVGAAPDGTRSVTIISDSSETSARVDHGIYVAEDSYCGPPDEVVLH